MTATVKIRRACRAAWLVGFIGSFADAAITVAVPLIAIHSEIPLIANAWPIFLLPAAIPVLGAIPLGVLFDRFGPGALLQSAAGAGIIAAVMLLSGGSVYILAATATLVFLAVLTVTQIFFPGHSVDRRHRRRRDCGYGARHQDTGPFRCRAGGSVVPPGNAFRRKSDVDHRDRVRSGGTGQGIGAPRSGQQHFALYYAGFWLLICVGLLVVALLTLYGRRLADPASAETD